MSRRKQRLSSAPAAKRRRTASSVPTFGAPTAEDSSLLQPSHFPSPTALSTRVLPQKGAVPSLSSLAARCFVMHIQELSENEQLWTYSKRYLKHLPDALVPKLFSMLRSSCPALLSHGLIVLVRSKVIDRLRTKINQSISFGDRPLCSQTICPVCKDKQLLLFQIMSRSGNFT